MKYWHKDIICENNCISKLANRDLLQHLLSIFDTSETILHVTLTSYTTYDTRRCRPEHASLLAKILEIRSHLRILSFSSKYHWSSLHVWRQCNLYSLVLRETSWIFYIIKYRERHGERVAWRPSTKTEDTRRYCNTIQAKRSTQGRILSDTIETLSEEVVNQRDKYPLYYSRDIPMVSQSQCIANNFDGKAVLALSRKAAVSREGLGKAGSSIVSSLFLYLEHLLRILVNLQISLRRNYFKFSSFKGNS